MCTKDRDDIENLSRYEETHLRSALISEGCIKAWSWIHFPEFLWFSLPTILWYHLKNRICRVLKALYIVVSFLFFLLTLITRARAVMFFRVSSSLFFEKIPSATENDRGTRCVSSTIRIFDNFELQVELQRDGYL